MGGAVSAGRNNDELVTNLCKDDYIRTPEVEKVFRQVDRADFMIFTDDHDSLEAYEDHPWRKGTLHLSAPCIYTRVMEALQFKKGVSFLNVGSGTGYMSTMVGLLIGPYGINHGIELYSQNVEFAQEKQEEFVASSPWYDPTQYCEPLFVVGNGLLLSPGNLLYDRIYCGAGCPPQHAQLMKNMLAVGGILVMPHGNQLESVQRLSQTEWKTEVVLPSVSFSPLILPSQESIKDLEPLEIAVQPLELKQCCRLALLNQIGRENYCRISELPLPQHLKDYLSYYKEWGPPSAPVKILCPIDHSKKQQSSSEDEQQEGAEEGAGPSQASGGQQSMGRGAARRRGAGGRAQGSSGDSNSQRRGQGGADNNIFGPSFAMQAFINGRKSLICNINGVFVKIPLDEEDHSGTDDEDSDVDDHDTEGEEEEEGEGQAEREEELMILGESVNDYGSMEDISGEDGSELVPQESGVDTGTQSLDLGDEGAGDIDTGDGDAASDGKDCDMADKPLASPEH